jgi:hypothetical protein
VETLQQVKAETGAEVEKLQGVRADVVKAKRGLVDVLAEIDEVSLIRDQVADEVVSEGQELGRLQALTKEEGEVLALTSRQVQSLKVARQGEAQALDKDKKKRVAAEIELADVKAMVVKAEAKLSRTEALMKALVEGIDMFGSAVLRWIAAPNPSEEKLGWGPNAPKSKEDRRRIATRIQPVMPKLAPLAQSISLTIEGILSSERAEIAADAAYVLEQRENLEADQRAELTRILNANVPTGPASDGPEM